MTKLISSLGIGWIVLWAILIYGSVVGWIMASHASVILGVLTLFVQGSGFVEWLVYEFGGYDIAQHLAHALGIS